MDFQKPIMSEGHMAMTGVFNAVFTIIGISEFPIQEMRAASPLLSKQL